jgi:dTDP-4-dehydrorhamnose reductase
MVELLNAEANVEVVAGKSRLQNVQDVCAELDSVKPTHVINAAGLTGRPNVDWCEDHKQEVIRTNVVGTVGLVDACFQRQIHVTNFATGCIYQYDDGEHKLGNGVGFTEEDVPNFVGSFYSRTKEMAERLQRVYDNVLVLRLRMPISDDLSERNFITKISKYERVVNIPNSMSVLAELLPVARQMAARRLVGVYNFTNPGTISHNQILGLYKQYIDSDFCYQNFTLEEQDTILKAPRSNNELDVTKLLKEFPDVEPIDVAIHGVFQRMAINLGVEK